MKGIFAALAGLGAIALGYYVWRRGEMVQATAGSPGGATGTAPGFGETPEDPADYIVGKPTGCEPRCSVDTATGLAVCRTASCRAPDFGGGGGRVVVGIIRQTVPVCTQQRIGAGWITVCNPVDIELERTRVPFEL